MWQIFTIFSLILNASETATDKVIMVAHTSLDTLIASFYRNFAYVALSFLIGITGIFGQLHFSFGWLLLFVAVLEIFNGIFYTMLLKNVEMTAASALSYATPFIFLLADLFIFKVSLNGVQVAGIMLLISGGLLFVIDHKTRRLKRQFTLGMLGVLFFKALIYGVEYYVFKYYALAQNLNEISYMVNVWLLVTIGLFILVIFKNKGRELYLGAARTYLPKITLSKSFDVGSSLFWFHALSFAAVSQVNSLAVFEPLILLIILFFVQHIWKFKADEDFTKGSFIQKGIATIILIFGAWLAG